LARSAAGAGHEHMQGTDPPVLYSTGVSPFFWWRNKVSVEVCREKRLMFFYIFGIVLENLLYNTVNMLFLFYNNVKEGVTV
jgi:hypothetical protein